MAGMMLDSLHATAVRMRIAKHCHQKSSLVLARPTPQPCIRICMLLNALHGWSLKQAWGLCCPCR